MEDVKIEEIANALRADILNLCHAIGLQGKIEHNDFVAYNPTRNDKHLGSFRVCIRGAKQGVWCEFASSERGDPLDLINYCLFQNSPNKHEAIIWAKKYLGLEDGKTTLKQVKQRAEETRKACEEQQKIDDENFRKYAMKIFFQAKPEIKGTPAELYFKARGIDFNVLKKQPHAIRFAEKCYFERNKKTGQIIYMPTVVTAIYNSKNEFVGVHRTFLEQVNGVWKRKTKKVLGSFAGGAIRLWRGKTNLPINKLNTAENLDDIDETLIICEGIEDGLSIAMACPEYRIWTSISVSNMQNIEIPKSINQVIIAGDVDGDQAIATKQVNTAADAFLRAGKIVKIARPQNAHDFNDELTGKNYKQS